MNKIVGFMNVLLLGLCLLALVLDDGLVTQRHVVIGIVLMFVPITLTMLALEPNARFLRSAIAANFVFIVLCVLGSGASIRNPVNVFLVPFGINLAALIRVWFRVSQHQREAKYEWASGDRVAQEDSDSDDSRHLEDRSANYLLRHWRGHLPLAVSYWVNSWGVTLLVAGILALTLKPLDDLSLRWSAAAAILLNAFLLIVGVWSTVGVWRSAQRHVSRGGRAVWATTAYVLVILGAIGMTTNAFVYQLPQVKEHWLIATNRDPIGHIELQLTRDREALLLTGGMGVGSAQSVREVLDENPDVKTLMLNSPGGRIVEGIRIATLVRERGLNTYVEEHCESACTFIFLAGADRASTANARIGFHRAFFPGLTPELDARMTKEMVDRYRSAGLADEFLARVSATDAQDMWYPTHEELIGAKVVNRTSMGGEVARASKYDSKAYLAFQYAGDPIVRAVNDHFRGAADQAASAAWTLYEQNAPDSQMWGAARRIITGYYARLLKTADDATVRSYFQIRLDQLRWAKSADQDTCASVATNTFDNRHGLPPDLYERELNWLKLAIVRSVEEPRSPLPAGDGDELMRRLGERVSPDALAAVEHPELYAERTQALCSGTLEIYEAVRALPLSERTLATRHLVTAQVSHSEN